MKKQAKSLYQLQYENAQTENAVNKGTGCIMFAWLMFFPAIILFILIFGGK